MSKNNWIIPFKGRYAEDSTKDISFLWKFNNIYIMDNHRLALWCQLQHFDESRKYDIHHIDAHYDFRESSNKKIRQGTR